MTQLDVHPCQLEANSNFRYQLMTLEDIDSVTLCIYLWQAFFKRMHSNLRVGFIGPPTQRTLQEPIFDSIGNTQYERLYTHCQQKMRLSQQSKVRKPWQRVFVGCLTADICVFQLSCKQNHSKQTEVENYNKKSRSHKQSRTKKCHRLNVLACKEIKYWVPPPYYRRILHHHNHNRSTNHRSIHPVFSIVQHSFNMSKII